MVGCTDFFEGYSDFRDGRVAEPERAAFQSHLDHCPSCARYDRVLRRGVEVARDLPELEPSDDFLPRLQHRIYHLEDERLRQRSSSGTSLGIAALLATVIGASAWLPAARPRPAVVALPPVLAHAPHREEALEVLFRPGPLLTREPQPLALPFAPHPSPSLLLRYSPLGAGVEAVPVLTLRVP